MNKQVIITKKAGQDIPRGYLQVALKNCPTYLGIATLDTGPLLEHSAEVKTYDLEELCKMLATLKDIPCVLQLGEMTQDFDGETDMMPYVFQTAGEKEGDEPTNILAVFLEGNFPNYAKVGSGHSDEYHMWEDFLFPTLLEKFQASDDIEDFYRRIRTTAFQQAVENPISHRGVAVFIPLTGEPICYGRNDIGGEYDWGTTSMTFDWGSQSGLAKAATAAIEAVKKPEGRLARALGSTAVAPPPPPASEITTDPKTGVHTVGNTTHDDVWSKWPGTSAKTHQMVSVPIGMQGNARNRWIRTFLSLGSNDDLPKGKDAKEFRIPVPINLIGFAQEDISTNDEAKALQSRVIKFRQGTSQPVSNSQVADAANTPVEDPNQVQKPKAPVSPGEFLPESPADEAKIAAELVTEWATNPKSPTATEVRNIEAKWPTFTSSRGVKLNNVARWNMKEKKEFTKKCPNDAARLISELLLKIGELAPAELEPAVVVPQPDRSKPQVEVPPAQPGPAPAQTGGRLARAKGQAA